MSSKVAYGTYSYTAPAFASTSAEALIERKKLLELMRKNKK